MQRAYRINLLMAVLGGVLLAVLPFQAMGGTFETPKGRPALLEFGAGYCHSCKVMAEIMADLQKSHGDQVEFRLVYADKEREMFKQYKIVLIPSQVFLNAAGQEVDRHIGALSKEEVLKKLKDLKFIR